MRLLIFAAIAALLALQVLASRREKSTSFESRAKRIKLNEAERSRLLETCSKGNVYQFNNDIRPSIFNSHLNKKLRRACLMSAVDNKKLKMVSRLLDFKIAIKMDIVAAFLRTGIPDFILLLIKRRGHVIGQMINDRPDFFAPIIIVSCPNALKQLINNASLESLKVYLAVVFRCGTLDMFIILMENVAIQEKRNLLLEYLVQATSEFSKRHFVIWIIAQLGSMTKEEITMTNSSFAVNIFQSVQEHRFDKLSKQLDEFDFSDLDLLLQKFNYLFFSACWLGDTAALKLLVKSKAFEAWLISFKLGSGMLLCISNRKIQAFLPEVRAVLPGLFTSLSLISVLESEIKRGEYYSVSAIIRALPKAWRRKFARKYPMNSKLRLVSRLIKDVEELRLNRVLLFIEQHPLELSIKFSLIDLLFNPRLELFIAVLQNTNTNQ